MTVIFNMGDEFWIEYVVLDVTTVAVDVSTTGVLYPVKPGIILSAMLGPGSNMTEARVWGMQSETGGGTGLGLFITGIIPICIDRLAFGRRVINGVLFMKKRG